jgi:hypothetical protein
MRHSRIFLERTPYRDSITRTAIIVARDQRSKANGAGDSGSVMEGTIPNAADASPGGKLPVIPGPIYQIPYEQ